MQNIEIGESCTWSFDFSGKPQPEVVWTTDEDEEIKTDQKFTLNKLDHNTKLTIKKAMRKVYRNL